MKEKMKKILKNRIFIFALGLSIAGSISVAAETFFPSNDVTYDNTESGLASTNVQGAIDELYNACFPPKAGDTIIDSVDIVTSGDGLYKDEYEEGKYTYKGKNPNNYITFNGEKAGWRIISINKDKTIKIIKIEDINTANNLYWDVSKKSNWKVASLNSYLNGNYYNGLNDSAKNQIVKSNYGIGTVTYDNNNMQAQIDEENSLTWEGNIALATASEYIRASSNKNSCSTFNIYNDNYKKCVEVNWIHYAYRHWWTLSHLANDNIIFINDDGSFMSYVGNSNIITVRPVVTLSSDIKITGGDGSQSNPYQLSL